MSNVPKPLPDVSKLPELPGMRREEIERDIRHPKAAAVMERLFAQDGPASLQEGDAAPDFELGRLHGTDAGERVQLSQHFRAGEARPVALVFGSYT